MNNLLTHYPVNWINGMKLNSRTHSYYTRHELKSLNTWKRVCDSRQQGGYNGIKGYVPTLFYKTTKENTRL